MNLRLRCCFASTSGTISALAATPWSLPNPLRPDVPVIMITAYGDAETKRKAFEGGAETLLTKPIDFVTLRSEIDMRVERAA